MGIAFKFTQELNTTLALLRAQEVEGFVDGLFGPEDEMTLPQKAHEAVQALVKLYSAFGGVADLLANEEQPASAQELKPLLCNLQQLALDADEAINKAVQSCKRARGQQLEAMAKVASRRIVPSERPSAGDPDLTDCDDSQQPGFHESSLSQNITRHGVAFASRSMRTHSAGGFSRSSTPRMHRTCGTSGSRLISRPWQKRFAHLTRRRSSFGAALQIDP